MAEENLSLQLDMLEMADESNLDQHLVHDAEEHPQPSAENCNLIVNYLPHDIDDLSIKGLFVEFGEIVMTKVVTDRNTKKSLGYGFVKFAREDDARRAIQKLNGFTIDHKCLKVSVARPPSLEIRNCKLYVTNLPKEYSEQDVINLFKEFGEIIECRVLKDKNSRTNKGVAFVQFDNKTQANNALSLNGCQLEGSSRGLGVKYAEDQHKKREMARLQSLTTHNVYRYLGGPVTPHDLPVDPYRMSPRSGERVAVDPRGQVQSPYFQPSPSPSHPQVPTHPYHATAPPPSHKHHAPLGQSALARSPVPPPSPSAQGYHGLGGINAVYGITGNGGGNPAAAPSLHHLQVPPVTLQMHPPGSGLASPVMGAVSPNHFLYQQQQMLQAQLTGATASPHTPMMSPSYSPRSVRRSNPGRGGPSSGRGNGYFDSIDMQPSPASYAQQAPQHVSGPGQQYGNWYSVAPPPQQQQQQQHHHPQHQPQMSYPTSGTGAGAGSSPVLSGLAPQQQPRHLPMHSGVSVDLGAPTGLTAQPQRSPAVRQSPLSTYGQSPQPQSHHASPHMQMPSPSAAGQSMYAPAGGAPGGPLLQPSPYLSANAHYYADVGRSTQSHFPHYGGGGGGGGSGSVTLSIANLPAHADVALLHDLFAPYARVLSAQIDIDAGGAPIAGSGHRVSLCSGSGRVQVATINQAEAACQALGGVRVGELPLQVNIIGGSAAQRK